MKNFISLILFLPLFFVACNGNRSVGNTTVAAETGAGQHDHSSDCDHGHDHAGHDHSGHNHSHDHSGHSHSGHVHSHSGHDHSHGNTAEGIVFPAEQAARTDFEVSTVEKITFTEVIKTTGTIMPAQGQEVTLVSPLSGTVSFAGVNLADGMNVGRGTPLFYVSSKTLASGDAFARTRAAFESAEAEFRRAERLLEDRIISQSDYERIRLDYVQAKNQFDAIAPSQSAKGSAVNSSIAGYVTRIDVAEGQYVEEGQSLATVSQNNRLVLRADVSQRYFSRLRTVTGANIAVPATGGFYRLEDLGGKLLSVGKSTGAGSPLIPVTFEFRNNGEVIPGQYVEVYLLASPVADAIAVPLTALTEQQGLYYVYVALDEEHYEKREVAVGGSDGSRVRILSGLCPSERLVTRGAVNIRMAESSGEIPHGHEH